MLATEIDLRLPKDVDYYTTLSGDIDSSVLAYFIKKILNKKVYPVFGISVDSQKNRKYWPGIGEETELSSSKHVASKLGLDLRITDFKNIKLSEEMKRIAGDGFDGCIDAGVASFGSLGEFVKEHKAKCMIVSEGPDELLGGYDSDIEANVIDQTIGPNKPLSFLRNLASTNLGKTFLTNFLRLKKNKEFEFKYKPFLTRVNHSVCPNQFINKITDNYNLKKFHEVSFFF